MAINIQSIQTVFLAPVALAWLSGCESSNHQNLVASQASSVNFQACGERTHGDFWFEPTGQTSINDTYVCPNGTFGSAVHFIEAEFHCEQGEVVPTGTTRLDPNPTRINCESQDAPPNSIPQVCTPGAAQSCAIANGAGQQTCNSAGSNWNACQVTSCNAGFINTVSSCALPALGCQGEAQVIGKVNRVVSTGQACWIFADYSWYRVNQSCPLDFDFVQQYGVYIPAANCPFSPGGTLTGVLYKSGSNVLLED